MDKEKLRIGLLIDDSTIPFWAYKMIESIKDSSHSEIVLVVRKKAKPKKKGALIKRLWDGRQHALFHSYLKIEKRLYKLRPNAFEPKNLKEIISCSEIAVQPNGTESSDRILKEDIDQIKAHQIDVFIKLGFRNLIGDILNSSKYGVWSYHHGDSRVKMGGPAGVWEVLEKKDETAGFLQILTEDLDGGIKLFESYSCTDKISINKNNNNFFWKAKSFIPRKLEELFESGGEEFILKHQKRHAEPLFYYNKLYTAPKNYELLKGLFLNYWKTIQRRINRTFFINQWILLFKIEESEKIARSFFRFERMLPPKDRFWADPFVMQKDNKYYIFIEELLYSENKGKISVIEMDENGRYGEPQVVLEKDYHLSYPFLFEENGQLYMLPETGHNKTIELYKCVNFPLEWELAKVLASGMEAVDSTIFRYNNKLWLFTNIKENAGASTVDELFLFYSDSLLEGAWTPHPQNPIISDAKCARPAGNIFVHKDRIFRPAQNCTKHYGYGMQIREIVKLSETEYEERQVQSIYPNWANDLIATHTFNFSGKLTVIDAIIKRRK